MPQTRHGLETRLARDASDREFGDRAGYAEGVVAAYRIRVGRSSVKLVEKGFRQEPQFAGHPEFNLIRAFWALKMRSASTEIGIVLLYLVYKSMPPRYSNFSYLLGFSRSFVYCAPFSTFFVV